MDRSSGKDYGAEVTMRVGPDGKREVTGVRFTPPAAEVCACLHDRRHTYHPTAEGAWTCDDCGAVYGILPICGARSGSGRRQRVCHLGPNHPGAHLDLVGKTGKYQETWLGAGTGRKPAGGEAP